ncbi:MAG TPA: hypothetical protein VNZ52_13895, partial [Candidatus Thermoplasmatota archaeon]|nr:hypothetical protein [Candidatus Thermoplasmatota archaeon]
YSGGCTAQGGAFTPTRTGLQRLRVSPSQGSYQITLSPVKGPCGVQSDGGSGADAPATESNAVLVQPGAPLQGCLDDVDKKDVYRIPVSASERVTVSIARDPVSGTFPRHLSAELVDDRGVVLRHWWGGYSAYDPSDQGLLSGVASRNGTWTLRFTGSGNHVAYGFTPTAEALPSPVQGASGGYVLNHAGAVQACGGTAYMVSRSGDVLRLGPTAATRLWSDPEDYPFTSHPACGADGSLLYSLPRYVNGRATGLLHEFAAPLGSTPPRAILPVDRLIAGPGGALYDATAKGLNRVDCSARTTTPVQPLPSGSFSYAFAPDGDLYAANATGLHRVGPTGALAPVFLPGTVGHPGRIAFDLLGNAYLGDGRENVIWRINLATGEGALLLGDAGGGPNLAFHGSRLWAAMYTGGNYRVAYWDLGVPGFEGWPAECEPAFADLTPTITGTSRGNGRYLNVDNFPGSRVVVHVDVTNVGPIALTGGYEVTLLVARECDPETVCPFPTPSEQETVVVKDPLEPGETRKLSLRFLPNFYLEGPTRVVVRVAPLVMGDGDRTNDEDERQLPLTSGIV